MNTFPPPAAFGLPPAFEFWRPDQQAAFQLMLDAPARFVGLTMPTGSGKSLAYMAAMVIGQGRGVALTSTKGLQDQLATDFSEMGLMDLRGQKNYPCKALLPGGELDGLHHGDGVPTCDEGPCHAGATCSLKEAGCEYYDRVRMAALRPLLCTNYAWWLAQKRYAGGLGKVDLLVLDEAHQAADELAGALTIKLDKWLLKAVGVESQPPEGGAIQTWRQWAGFHSGRLRKKLEHLGKPGSANEVKYRRRVKAVERVLTNLSGMEIGNWIEDHEPDAWKFEVLSPAAYAEELLFQGAKKVVLLSATLTQKTLSLLGIKEDAVLWECPSRFPVARRPVYFIPTCKVDSRMKPEHWTMWGNRIDQIVGPRQQVKGIAHTVSYKRAQYLLTFSQHTGHLITHSNKPGELAKVVAQFKKSQKPGLLVSPSLSTGWDFPYAQCRYQIVTKLPFPDTQSKVLKARCEIDPDLLAYLTMQSLEQSVGRGMRAEDDWCETFIIDDNWKWFLPKFRKFATECFLQALRTSLTIPAPLDL